jgi:hypothetical protein
MCMALYILCMVRLKNHLESTLHTQQVQLRDLLVYVYIAACTSEQMCLLSKSLKSLAVVL